MLAQCSLQPCRFGRREGRNLHIFDEGVGSSGRERRAGECAGGIRLLPRPGIEPAMLLPPYWTGPTPSESERTYVWDVSNTNWGTCAAKGQFITSSRFSCGGVDNLTLQLYPQGRESCPSSRPGVTLHIDAKLKLVASWKVTVETVGGEEDTVGRSARIFASPSPSTSHLVCSAGRPPFRTVTVTLLEVWRAWRPEEVCR